VTGIAMGVLRSVRFRITALAAALVALVLVAAGALLLAVQQRQLTEQLDETLAQRVGGVIESDLGDGTAPQMLASLSGDDTVVQVFATDGRILAATENAAALDPISTVPSAGRDLVRSVDDIPIEDDSYRVLARLVSDARGERVVAVAANTDDMQEVLRDLRTALALVIPLATVLLAGAVWWLVGRTLRPVDAIRREVAGLELDDLDHRVPERGSGDEIDRLAVTMNAMLERLDEAAERQRRFVADASHELRSPLTRMRTALDLERADPEADLAATHRALVEEVDQLSALVDDLLHLARSDAARGPVSRRSLDLDDIVMQEVVVLRDRAGVVIDTEAVSAANVDGDPGELRRVVRNLGDNAVRHAAQTVTFGLLERDVDGRAEAVLTVTDDGPGVTREEAETIFDRFARLDDARARDTGGTGLGLAIARDIVERHGGRLDLDAQHRPGARFVVVLPAGGR
jgi:signal transduction histidine kinase